nr:reverse transcriptase domain-containing protein [Tanacetum cinerariifolium]
MPPNKTATTTPPTPMTDAQIKALIARGVANALAERDAEGAGITMTTMIQGATKEGECLLLLRTDVLSYNRRFQELALMCERMFLEESDVVEKYVGGLPNMIYGSVMASKPKTMHDAIEFATELTGQKICTIAERQDENKRKFDDNNQTQQQPPKKQNVAMAYFAGSNEKREYAGTLPLCNKCKFHHNGPCTTK